MYVKPGVDRARFRENLAAAMVGQDAKTIAHAAKISDEALQDARQAGIADDGVLVALAKALGLELRALAPFIDLRDPDRGDRLPLEGRDVPETDWWRRRISDGDAIKAEIPPEPKARRGR